MRSARTQHEIPLQSNLWDTAPHLTSIESAVPALKNDPMDRSAPETAWRLLEECGYKTPDEAWLAWKRRPKRPALVVELGPHILEPPSPKKPERWLRWALVLGKCRRDFFDPEAPVLWTMRRLGRPVLLVEIQKKILD